MRRQTKIVLGVASFSLLAVLAFQLHLVWNGTFDRVLDSSAQYVRVVPRDFVKLPSSSYLMSLIWPVALMTWGLIEFSRSRTGTLRTGGLLLASTASLTFLLILVVWLLGPNEPASVMAQSPASSHLIRTTQALYFMCIDLESMCVISLLLFYSETPADVLHTTPYRCTSPNAIHRDKVQRIVRELEAKGLDRYSAAPLLFRFLWTLGVEIPPPLFLGFVPLILIFGVSFATGLLILLWLMFQVVLLLPSAFGGVLFGLSMAAYFSWRAKTLRLTAWKNYVLD